MAVTDVEKGIYSHRVVKVDGVEMIIPKELDHDPYRSGRVMTLQEAAAIVSVLSNVYAQRSDAVEQAEPADQIVENLFTPGDHRGPAAIPTSHGDQKPTTGVDPFTAARDAIEEVSESSSTMAERFVEFSEDGMAA